MRFGRDQNSELTESRGGRELALVSIDLQLTQVVEDSFRGNRPYHIRIESRRKTFGSSDAVDLNFYLAHVAVTL